MHSTSTQQADAIARGELPALEQVRDDVWSLAQPMPGGHLAYSLTYLLRGTDGGIHVIDPGWDSDANWGRLTGALTMIAPDGVVTGITGTHLHPDHVGMAARLRRGSGAPLAMHGVERAALERHATRVLDADEVTARLDAWHVPRERRDELSRFVDRSPAGLAPAVDRSLSDGDVLPVTGFRTVVMDTPGHTAGHICLRDDDRGLLYTGDHVLPTVVAGLGLGGATPSSPLADYLTSIDRVRRYGHYEALPGHGHRFAGLGERAHESAEHHLKRTREVAAVLEASGEPTVWDLASRLTWTAGWEGLQGFQLLSALSQTEMHRDFVRARALPVPKSSDSSP
ncbi:MBL fold metallo-hydrolase [Arthrobacter sp. TMS2-4]